MNIHDEVETVKQAWENSTYYADAEKWLYLFWDKNTHFRRLFDQLNLENVVELACGYGRHSEQVAPTAGKLTLVDVFEGNLEKCRIRLSRFDNVTCYLGSGLGFTPIESNKTTAIFCYDAMVHFSMNIILSYLKDTSRILCPGGLALYHHSNNSGPILEHYGMQPHARNVMNFDLFSQTVSQLKLQIVESVVIDWGGVKGLDRITLLKKI